MKQLNFTRTEMYSFPNWPSNQYTAIVLMYNFSQAWNAFEACLYATFKTVYKKFVAYENQGRGFIQVPGSHIKPSLNVLITQRSGSILLTDFFINSKCVRTNYIYLLA